jgi:PAS domain S-box-containing protein
MARPLIPRRQSRSARASRSQSTPVGGIRTREQLVRRTLRTSLILCFVALLLPALTAVGWVFGIEWLTRGHPALPVMHPNTAAGLAAGAVAVLVTAEQPSMSRRTATALLLSSAVLLLGLLTLREYAFGWDAGIDRIFTHRPLTASEPFPNRPSPQTSLNFVLLGATLLSFNLGWPIRLGQTVATLAGANAIAALTGYIFSARTFYGFPPYASTGMSVPTAVSFILLAAAVLCRRPADGMMTLVTSETHSGSMARRILRAAIIAPPLVGMMTRLGAAAGWYSLSTEGSLFVLILAALVVRTTWRAARRSEHEERQARAAIDALARANEELNRVSSERQMFGALVENSSDFIGIADPAGKPVYVNPAGRHMVGLAPDFPVERTTIPDYYAPDQRALASEVILPTTVDRGHWEGETAFRHWQTEEAIPVSDTHFMIREPATGRLIGFGTVTRDISEIKRAREEIERTNRRLAQANELKTRFFANVSHELRTPLTLILGPVEKYLRTAADLTPDLRRDFEVIERNARTVLRHVNDLVDVAKIHAGGLTPEYSRTDAAAIVRAVCGHFSTLANENQIQFIVETPAALEVETDLDKLHRILLNLVSNAFKFTPDGGRVRVSLREGGPRFRVEVADSGPGIPADKREAVFERFEQLETDTTRPRAGTGLGLSIVRDFAALLEGRVSVGDAPEGGALFVVEMPSTAPSGAAVRPLGGEQAIAHEIEQLVDELRKRHPAPDADLVATKREAGRVLLVEDNRDMSAFIAGALRSDGFEVSLAFDGREGYDKAVVERPDLVLADLMMPRMSGDALVRELRQRPELDSTPIIVLTAVADEGLRIRLLGEGVQDFLNKPFSIAELRARVRNLVARKAAEDRISRLQGQIVAVSIATSAISEAVTGLPEDSVRTVLQTIALNAQNLTGAEYAAAGIGADPTRPFEIWAFVGMSPEQAAMLSQPAAGGLLGFMSTENRSVRLCDLREHPSHRGFPQQHPEMRSLLGTPIRYRGQVAGSLFLANKRDGAEFTADDQQVVEMLAARAGVAIETARLYAAEGRAHAWLQAVVDQMPEGVLLMDAQGRVTVENQALRALTNTRPPVPDRFGNAVTIDLRRPSGEPLSPDDFPIVKAMVDQEIIWGEELIARRIDNRLVPLLVSAAPILTADRRLTGAVMVFQDISVLKELEHLREEWASIIAHDLRQPISVIALRSALLERGHLSDQQRNDLRQIHASADRLNRMTSDLMDASLLEIRRLQVTVERLDLSQFLRDVVQRVPPGAPRTKLRLPADCRLFVRGDAHRLEQVLANVLANAVKYGAPDADIFLEARPAQENAEILVTNHGAGISRADLPLLFERFFRSHRTETGTPPGLGLGLYIAKGLVEAHKGRIWAESVPGDVTTFHIVIPLDGPPLPAEAPASDETGASHPELQGTRS